jgi:F0F1-type ATP synthase membrane subunit c/vacuolar-type H+-ATPase subunit K
MINSPLASIFIFGIVMVLSALSSALRSGVICAKSAGAASIDSRSNGNRRCDFIVKDLVECDLNLFINAADCK